MSNDESGYIDYLLDYDLFRQGGRPFDVEGLIRATEQLNLGALQLFQTSVTEQLLDIFRTS